MKFYSQNDEDGILMEILNRINIKQGNFFEIGVCGGHKNNGTECNTIILLMLGWNGIWIDGVNIDLDLPKESKLNFFKQFLNKDNCIKTFNDALEKSKINKSEINVVSVDIDGNDFYITESILKEGFQPDCFIVEYNGKFPPPIIYNMPYDENYVWKGGDEQGCSLQFYVNFFDKFGYNLYRDVGDLYGKNNSQRQYYTMPATTMPNDQTAFAKWCYNTGPTCKERGLYCAPIYSPVKDTNNPYKNTPQQF